MSEVVQARTQPARVSLPPKERGHTFKVVNPPEPHIHEVAPTAMPGGDTLALRGQPQFQPQRDLSARSDGQRPNHSIVKVVTKDRQGIQPSPHEYLPCRAVTCSGRTAATTCE